MSDGDRWDDTERERTRMESLHKQLMTQDARQQDDQRQEHERFLEEEMCQAYAEQYSARAVEIWPGKEAALEPPAQPDQCKACEELETRLETLEADFDRLVKKLGVDNSGDAD